MAFDRFMEGIDISKYLKNIPEYITGRNRYNPVDMLKTVLFAFADNGYCSLRKLEDNKQGQHALHVSDELENAALSHLRLLHP